VERLSSTAISHVAKIKIGSHGKVTRWNVAESSAPHVGKETMQAISYTDFGTPGAVLEMIDSTVPVFRSWEVFCPSTDVLSFILSSSPFLFLLLLSILALPHKKKKLCQLFTAIITTKKTATSTSDSPPMTCRLSWRSKLRQSILWTTK
jgi:hypothetical protein